MPLSRLKYSKKIRVLFVPVFVLMAMGLLVVYQISVHSLAAEHEERLQRTARLTADGLLATEKEMMKMADLFQTNRTLKEYLYLSTILGGDREPLRDLLKPLSVSLDIDDVDLFDTRGRRVIDLDVVPNTEERSLVSIAGALPQKVIYGFTKTSGTLEVVAITPLIDKTRTVGYISVGKYLDSRYFNALKETSGNALFWVDAGGIIVNDNGHAPYHPHRGKLTADRVIYSIKELKLSAINGEPLGTLVIALSDDNLSTYTDKLKLYMVGLLCIAALLIVIMTQLFIRTLVDPLKKITELTGKVAQGELDNELRVQGRDEIALLAGNFNDMQKQLKAQQLVVKQYTDNLELAVDLRTAELRAVQQQLVQSQKMEAVGQMAGGIAHDFNNILTAIMGYAGFLKKKIPAGEVQRGYVEQILASSRRAAELTNGLLAFSRKQVINPMPIDLNETIEEMEKLLERLIGDDIELKIDLAQEPLVIMADSGPIGQVLMNLSTNSRDAMPRGGCITIETRQIDLDATFVRQHASGKPGAYALLSVTDSGVGIDDAIRDKIFEPFFTTKEVGKGTGLGLAMVYGIVKQHGGLIDLLSDKGHGTSFMIYLPLISETSGVVPFVDQDVPKQGGIETILLAEDDAVLRELAREGLEDAGYTVITAVDGDDAVKQFAENRDAISLLLLDVVMPKRNGKEVFDTIRTIQPDINVIFVSGYTADIIQQKGVIAEGLTLIRKPYSQNDLLARVRHVLDGMARFPV